MKITLFSLMGLLILFAISLATGWKHNLTNASNLKYGMRGLAVGIGVLFSYLVFLVLNSGDGYKGRCHQLFWYDDIGTPCTYFEYFGRNSDMDVAFTLLWGSPLILIFLGICVVAGFAWPKFQKHGNTAL